jgi:hypothetical protein
MPYIKSEKRKDFETEIQSIVDKLDKSEEGDNSAKGELNYIIYSIIKRYLDKKGMRYFRAQDFIGGVLTCCQMELYRRLLAPYEDNVAIKKNGDVL